VDLYSAQHLKTSNALVTLVKTKQDCLKKLLKTFITTRRMSELAVCLKSEIHEIQSLSRNPLSNQRNPLPKERYPRNPLTYYEIHLYIAKTN